MQSHVAHAGQPQRSKQRSLLPKEHGAYAQLLFPLAAALLAAKPTLGGATLALAAVAAFFAHEPLLVVLGHRGERARFTDGDRAAVRLRLLGAVTLAGGLVHLFTSSEDAVLATMLPLTLALPLGWLVVQRREKTTGGELLAALTLSSLAVPIMLASGVSADRAALALLAWGLVFTTATLSVRYVIARSKGRRSPGLLTGALVSGFGPLAVAAAGFGTGSVPGATLLALAPVSLLCLGLCAVGPHARHLKTIGWMIVGACVVMLGVLQA